MTPHGIRGYLEHVRSLDRRGWIMLGLTLLAPVVLAVLLVAFLLLARAVGFVAACVACFCIAYVLLGNLGLTAGASWRAGTPRQRRPDRRPASAR